MYSQETGFSKTSLTHHRASKEALLPAPTHKQPSAPEPLLLPVVMPDYEAMTEEELAKRLATRHIDPAQMTKEMMIGELEIYNLTRFKATYVYEQWPINYLQMEFRERELGALLDPSDRIEIIEQLRRSHRDATEAEQVEEEEAVVGTSQGGDDDANHLTGWRRKWTDLE